MTKDPVALPSSRSWRDIPQQVRPRAMSAEGRRRVAFAALRLGAGVVLAGFAAWMVWQVAAVMRSTPAGVLAESNHRPVRPPVLITDGVLTNAWLARTLALPPGATLMSLDLFKLRARVLADDQVTSAAVERNPPDILTVRLSERSPVARIMAQVGPGDPHPFFVARDGVVFAGTGFDPAMVASLPWIDGVKLVRRGAGFVPLEGIVPAADLMAMAKLEADRLYRTWQVVSLGRVASDGLLEVRTRDGLKIVFATSGDYLRQLARLDLLLDAAGRDPARPIREVNLALGSQVPVQYGAPAAPAAGHAGPPVPAQRPSFILPAFPQITTHPQT